MVLVKLLSDNAVSFLKNAISKVFAESGVTPRLISVPIMVKNDGLPELTLAL